MESQSADKKLGLALRMAIMQHSIQMSGTSAATKKATVQPVIDQDEVIFPIRVPKRLPYRPSIPARELRKIVFKVVRERQAREREAALNGKNS